MTLTINGISTTTAEQRFAHELYYSPVLRKNMIQWDYRDSRGKLHSGVARSVEQAKKIAEKRSSEKII